MDRILHFNYTYKVEERCSGCPETTIPFSDDKLRLGLIAQDVEKVVPEVVREMKNDRERDYSYSSAKRLHISGA